MQVVSTTIEPLEHGRLRLITVLEPDTPEPTQPPVTSIGEGPDRDTVPDKVVRFLIGCGPDGAQMSEIQRAVGGNASTANRQIWTLGTNAGDLPGRLRGWVEKKGGGRYALTEAARAFLGGPGGQRLAGHEMVRALQMVAAELPEVMALAKAWQDAASSGGNVGAARQASDEALFALLATSRQANTLFGYVTGWESTEMSAPLIRSLEQMGQSYRMAVHAPIGSQRLEALEYLGQTTDDALRCCGDAFGSDPTEP